MSENVLNVLVVDDDRVVRDFLTRLLKEKSIRVKTAEDGFAAIEAAEKDKFDVAFLDIKMPRMNGLQTFSKLKRLNPHLTSIFITGYAPEEALLEKTSYAATTICLRKPFEDIRQIKKIVNKLLQAKKTAVVKDVQERRAYVRLDVELEVEYRIRGEGSGRNSFFSKNISPCGMRILSQRNIAVGTTLDMVIKAPEHNKTCKATGIVIWNRQAVGKTGYYDIGIEFEDIDFSKLTEFLIY